jgi:hypothetical protein
MIVLANLVEDQCTVCNEHTSIGPRTKSNEWFCIFRGLVMADLSCYCGARATFHSFDNDRGGQS